MTTAALFCLATTIYMEARGEPLPGQFAVAEVVLRRARSASPLWPDRVCSVVYQSWQFTWTHTQVRPNRTTPAWRLAMQVAHAASIDDTGEGAATRCATYFASGIPPAWMRALPVDIRIGGHTFFCPPGERPQEPRWLVSAGYGR